jgi:hypothetical protein
MSVKNQALSDAKSLRSAEKGHALHMLQESYFTDEADCARTESGKGASDVSFESWRVLYEKYGRNPLPAADLTVVRDASDEDVAIVRYRSGDEVRQEAMTLDGKEAPNPLLILKGGAKFEVLALIPDTDGTVSAYVKVSNTTANLEGIGFPIATKLAWMLSSKVEMYLRTDSWFISDSAFPIVFRFEAPSLPPTESEYNASPTLHFSSR